MQLKGLIRPKCHPHGHVSIFLISSKSNAITNIFVKSILVQKIAYSSILLCSLIILK